MISSRSLPLLLVLTLIILVAVSPALGIFDCCHKYTEKKFTVSQVGMFKSYYSQESAGVCNIDAIVFKVNTKPCGKPNIIRLCADPKQKWVKKMISAVDKQAKRSKRNQQKKLNKLCRRPKKSSG
ncbi:C-C motif chemokine 20-like [Leptodactylus fuscus]|uniref:C-C motif chemokine 20-like n=1 Tax=Leptodactylus fuscus TaxID=238119 RepID=UPI003F4F3D0D